MSDPQKLAEWRDRYTAAMHGVQSAIAFLMERGDKSTMPKHLRVGVDSAMVNDHALATLLIGKGVITEEEYYEQLAVSAEQELERYTRAADPTGRTQFA